MKHLIVSVAGLGWDDVQRRCGGSLAGLRFQPAESVYPAVTCTAQATLRTGLTPREHGMTSNGYYARDLEKPAFWEQSSRLVQGRRIWEDAREAGATVGMFFFQQSFGEYVDALLSPAPIHKHGGGMMLDWGVHLIDQMLQFVKSPVSSLYCEYSYIYGEEVEDGCELSVLFENGVRYKILVATDCFRNLPRWQIYGVDGTATIADWDISGGMTRVIERQDKNLVGVRAGNGFTKTMAQRSDSSVEELPLPVTHAKPFAFYANFAAAAQGKEEPAIHKEEVLRVFRLMEAAQRSAETNEVIKIRI